MTTPQANGRVLHELPQPLHLFELLTGSRHYHFGYFVNGQKESMATAMDRLSQECLAQLEPGARVLDVGCALGGTSIQLAAAGCDVVAIDPCVAAITYCHHQERVEDDLTRARFECVDLESFARREAEHESYDGIVMIEALQHFPRLADALGWCRRLLVPGGILVVSDIAKLPDLSWSRVPFHRKNQLVHAARDAGFEVVECRDVTAHVIPTMARLGEMVRGLTHRLPERLSTTRPQIRQEADELLVQLQHLGAGLANGDLTYEWTVLRRP